jgi:hypothetical protein
VQERGAGTARSSQAPAKNPVDPFIDPEGHRAYIDGAESEFRGVR